ncbi:MAG: hypothetical protein ABI628_00175 [Chloroflexota bacterium]
MTNLFHPSELTGGDAVQPTTADLGQSLLIARELESLLAATDVHPSDRFVDRVMSAVVAQPLPQPAVAAGLALRGGRFGAMLAALADNWRITFSGDHPFPVRAQALAFVLVAVLALGSVGGVATIGAVRLLGPAPSVAAPAPTQQGPVVEPTPSPVLGPIIAPTDHEGTPEPSTTPEPTETAEPTEGQGPAKTPRGTETAQPSETDEPKETDEPNKTEEPGHGHVDGASPD